MPDAQPLTSDEARALINAPSRRAPTGIRNRALVALLYRSGLRIAEALDLAELDVDHADAIIRVRRGKGGRARTIGVDPGALALLERWLEVRRDRGLSAAPIFCTLAGNRLQSSYVRQLLPRLGRKAGIEKRVHAHGLRHTFALELAREGVPMNLIQRQLGHKSLQTTAIYLEHIAPFELVDVVRARSWTV